MPLAIKLDEDLSPAIAAPLLAAGHDVATIVGQGWGGMTDPDLWPLVKAEGRFFITADKGFGDIRAYPPGSHPGILVLRPERESIAAFRGLVDEVLQRHNLVSLKGMVTIASPGAIRIRRSDSM